jgi:hypothetical protein
MTSAAVRQVIRAGTTLWRVHDRATTPVERGGLFSRQPACALIEALLPDPRFTSAGLRVVPEGAAQGRVLDAVRTTGELVVLRVDSRDDEPEADPAGVDGVAWPSPHAWPELQLRLAEGGFLEELPASSMALDDEAGRRGLAELLAPYRIDVRRAAPATRPVVFLNYRTRGGTEEVYLLDAALRSRLGEPAVFRDNRGIKAGAEYPEALLTAVRSADVLLAMIGRDWEDGVDQNGVRLIDQSSDWVRREIAEAFRCGVQVVPILVGARTPLVAERLPEELRRLADLQYVQMTSRRGEAEARMVVDQLLAEVPPLAAAAERYDSGR